jgi:nicotinamide mononucleotide adenylyltransferase
MVKDNYQYDLALFIGRMRPPTIPHIQNIKYGLSIANKLVVQRIHYTQMKSKLLLLVP